MEAKSPFLDTNGAACFLGTDESGQPLISPRTLEKWRITGTGPRFSKLGRRVCYTREDLLAWAASRLRMSTSECVRAVAHHRQG